MESSPFIRQHGSIPEELVILIHSHLPIKSLARFRCVSKVWRSLISDPKFIFSSSQKHLRIAVKARSEVYSSGVYRPKFDSFSFGAEEASSSDVILAKPMVCSDCTRRGQILGSCNGLLLVFDDDTDLYLWNPTTRQCTKMLSIVNAEFYFNFNAESGLCYDSNCDDYKAVMVGRGLVTVVSFKRKSWATKTCSFDSEDYDRVRWDSRPVVNEKLHWVLSPRYASYNYLRTRVIYFDPLTEEFAELPMPLLTDNGKHITVVGGLGVLKGYLYMTCCVFETDDEVEHDYDSEYDRGFCIYRHDAKLSFIEVFVMKEHGVGESWTSSFIIPNNDGVLVRSLDYYRSLVPLYLTKNGGILFSVDGKKFLLYNPDEMSQMDIHIRFQPDHFSVGSYEASYVETLPADCGLEGGWSSWTVERSDDWVVEPSDASHFQINQISLQFYEASYVESLASPADYTPEEDWRVEVSDALHLLFRHSTCSSWSESWPASPYWVSDNEEDNEEDNSIEEHDDYVFMNGNGKDKERFFIKAKTRRYSLSRKEKKQKAQRRIKAKSKLTYRRKNQRKDKRREVEDFGKKVLDFSVN